MGNSYRVRLAGALAAIVLLGGCSDRRSWSEAEIADVARDAAADGATDTSELEAKVAELEAQVRELNKSHGQSLDNFAKYTRADVEDGERVNRELRRLTDNDMAFKAQIDFLRARQGLPSMPSE